MNKKHFIVFIAILSLAFYNKAVNRRRSLVAETLTTEDTPLSENGITKQTGPFKAKIPATKQFAEQAGQEYLTEFVYPFDPTEGLETIQMNFKDVALSELNEFIARSYNVTFIPDDAVTSEAPQQTAAFGTAAQRPLALNTVKLSFHTNKPMTKKQAWDLYTTFLDLAGLTLAPGPEPRIYRITNSATARGALPTYLGVDPNTLPDNDMKIRYLYFVENGNVETIALIVNTIKSSAAAPAQSFPELGAILITEKASNIKAIMRIVREIDRVTMPEAMSVIKLRQADATTVANQYAQLIGDANQPAALYQPRPRKPPTKTYFPQNMRIIAEPRTNTLILLGTHEAIKKVEDFIRTEIDKQVDLPYSPLHIYKLKYAYAPTVAQILQQVTAFNPQSIAAQYGGVRDGDKYFKPMNFVAEPQGNRIIINADYEDYLKVYELLKQIDVEQRQVAINMLILSVDNSYIQELGAQIRNRADGAFRSLFGKNVNFQTSGLNGNGIITNPVAPTASPEPPFGSPTNPVTPTTQQNGAVRLLGNLINLAVGNRPGTTLVTLGRDIFGIIGVIRTLETQGKIQVVNNPFFIATHKTPAVVTAGQTRRVLASITKGVSGDTPSNQDLPANLTVQVTPLISEEGLITLSINVTITDFTSSDNTSGDRTIKNLSTQAVVVNKEVLGLGGLVETNTTINYTKVPILGDIPVLGWLFKNEQRVETQSHLIILMSAEIIEPHDKARADEFTDYKVKEAKDLLCQIEVPANKRDPIHRWIFREDHINNNFNMIDSFMTASYNSQDVTQQAPETPDIKPVKRRSRRSIRDYVAKEEHHA